MQLSRLTLAIAILPGLALGASNADPVVLEPSVVTRTTNLNLPAASSVAVIDRAIIEDSGALSLLDLLRSQAGLQIRDTMGDGNRAAISLRGFGENAGSNTLVLVDGRRLNQPSQATPDLNSVPLANIERIEIMAFPSMPAVKSAMPTITVITITKVTITTSLACATITIPAMCSMSTSVPIRI